MDKEGILLIGILAIAGIVTGKICYKAYKEAKEWDEAFEKSIKESEEAMDEMLRKHKEKMDNIVRRFRGEEEEIMADYRQLD
jgi:transposase